MSGSALAPPPEPACDDLANAIEAVAAPRDAGGAYPRAALDVLVARGLTAPETPLPSPGLGGMCRLLDLLATVGRGDASVGRLLEGQANAVALIGRLAPEPLRARAFDAARSGAILGVWGPARWRIG